MSMMREGVASLYRGLDATKSLPDKTFEKERMACLATLNLIPPGMLEKVMGATSQTNTATAGLGLFARNRGIRAKQSRTKRVEKSHKEVVMDQQNLRRRLAYAKELNVLVKDMGDKFVNDEPIPLNTWTEYDRLQRNPAYRQKTKQELEIGASCMEPGPGAYLGQNNNAQAKRGKALPVTFGATERWRKDTSVTRKSTENEEKADDVSKRLCLSQKKGMRWNELERTKLNELYWELGRPRKKIFMKDHLDLYAKRHQVLFSNRPADEIIERVRYMLKFNQFKEKGEVGFWDEKRKQKEVVMTKPGRNQRKLERSTSASRVLKGTVDDMFNTMAKGDLTMKRKGTVDDDESQASSSVATINSKKPVSGPPSHRPLPKTPQETGASKPFSREAGAMYGGRMQSPFTTSLSNFKEAPGFSFTGSSRNLGASNVKHDENTETNEPPESSSVGVQLLSHNTTMPALSFKRAGVGGINLSVGEQEEANEPTATTYHPDYQVVKPRIPAYGLSDRLNDEKWTDKFAALTGPGSYEEGGSVGRQALSTKNNAARTTFSTVDRLKFMSNFAIA
jgi:hypothetical protein